MDVDVEMRSSSSPTPPPPVLAAAPPSTPKKPKSERKVHHSPTPPPVVRPPPLRTIRLEITLGGPENYEVDISRLALETGQREEVLEIAKAADTSDSEQEPEVEASPATNIGKKKKRKNFNAEYYDTNDPFIDDSELAIDERKFFAQTKQRGFYVSSGQVALVKEKDKPMKPKSRVKISSSVPEGARESPIAIDGSDDDDHGEPAASAGQKRKRYISVVENGKKRKIVDITCFHPAVKVALEELKAAVAHEDWSAKGKFPPTIKPILAKTALVAIEHDEYDDDFFNLMPTLFPYNKFTMSKLIKRTVFLEHTQMLQQRQEKLLAELAKISKDGFKKAEEDWQNAVVAWDRRQERVRMAKKLGLGFNNGEASPVPPTRPGTPTGDDLENKGGDADVDGDKDGEKGEDGKADRDAHPPQKKYRMTDQMKNIVWELVLLSNECCRLENEKNQLENSVIQVSEQGLRKVLYQKIVAVFPEGWMSSGQISRDVSAIKKRLEKEQMENDS